MNKAFRTMFKVYGLSFMIFGAIGSLKNNWWLVLHLFGGLIYMLNDIKLVEELTGAEE